ncbi:ScbR family autoregulator-binding transcription factor [Leifsonia kafniensis]|uniref:ScbR family autoregulator-binding transcription factor n=1 Tax=Leifsonia kafniensis TaxID=475957 RepID=A0ABP7KXZ7_9MICO
MAQQQRAANTREAIVTGAATAFQAHGYGMTSLAEIAEASGVTKGALYFHFDSKEAIALAVIDAQHAAAGTIGVALHESGTTGIAATLTASFAFARQLRENPIARAGIRLTLEASSFQTPVVGPYLDWIAWIEGYLVEAAAAGDLREEVNPSTLAHLIIPAFTGVQMVSEVLTHRDDIYQRVEELWLLLLPGTVPPDRWEQIRELLARIRREVSEQP